MDGALDFEHGTKKLWQRRMVQFWGLVLAGLVAILCVFWNTMVMKQELEETTREYGREVSSQMRDTVSLSIESKLMEMENLADSLTQVSADMDAAQLTEFLTRKAEILEFHTLYMVDGENTCVAHATLEGDSQTHQPMEADVMGRPLPHDHSQVGFLAGRTLYYTAPVAMEGEQSGLLIGIRERKAMENLISSSAFQNSTLSCIVDSQGNAVLLPENVAPFEELKDYFPDSRDVNRQLGKMRLDMEKGLAGTVLYTGQDREELLMAYNPISVNNWFMLTIVPVNLMSGELRPYFLRTAMIMVGLTLMFFLLSALVSWTYSDNQKKLSRLAYVDPITGGMNGEAFRQYCRGLRHQEKIAGCTLVLMNIRRFKMINDKLGFESGNEILRMVHRALCQSVDLQKGERAARSEMDNFLLCLREGEEAPVRQRIAAMIQDINHQVETRFPGNRLTFTVGCATVDTNSQDVRNFFDQARLASQGEEAQRQVCVFYHEGSGARLKREQELDASFAQSLRRQDFLVYFQPKMDLDTGKLTGAEALVRWQHPTLGLLSPGEFVPMLERSGKIVQLDFYVFQKVCQYYHQRKEAGEPWYPISVNLSRYHFYQENFLEPFCQEAERWDLPGGAIEFELTESMFFDEAHNQKIREGIDQMHRHGFLCSMDDFGSGYSSLGLLKEFDVDTLKLDRGFFLDISSEKARWIIRSTVDLAARLNMETVAEGIEEPSQVEFLKSTRCNTLQGYYVSKPLPMEEFELWARRWETSETSLKHSPTGGRENDFSPTETE